MSTELFTIETILSGREPAGFCRARNAPGDSVTAQSRQLNDPPGPSAPGNMASSTTSTLFITISPVIDVRRLGPVNTIEWLLLRLKMCQSRREARSLVIPNEQRATPNGTFSSATRRAGALFPFNCVISRLFGTTYVIIDTTQKLGQQTSKIGHIYFPDPKLNVALNQYPFNRSQSFSFHWLIAKLNFY